MATEAAQQTYGQRSRIAEFPTPGLKNAAAYASSAVAAA